MRCMMEKTEKERGNERKSSLSLMFVERGQRRKRGFPRLFSLFKGAACATTKHHFRQGLKKSGGEKETEPSGAARASFLGFRERIGIHFGQKKKGVKSSDNLRRIENNAEKKKRGGGTKEGKGKAYSGPFLERLIKSGDINLRGVSKG